MRERKENREEGGRKTRRERRRWEGGVRKEGRGREEGA